MKKNTTVHDDLIEKYRAIDFSETSKNKDEILEKLLVSLKNNETNKEMYHMNKRIRKPAFALAAALSVILTFSIVVYGQEAVRFVKEAFIGRYAHYFVENNSAVPVPKELEGKIFDKDGNPISEITRDYQIYTKSGEEAFIFLDDSEFLLLSKEEFNQKLEEEWTRDKNVSTFFDNLTDATAYFKYDFMNPAYLPDGYKFEKAEIYNDESGAPVKNTKYMSIYYSNGKENICIMLRFMDEETAFTASHDGSLQELSINGYPAIISGRMLDVEIDGIMYSLFRNDSISMDEIIKMAESLSK